MTAAPAALAAVSPLAACVLASRVPCQARDPVHEACDPGAPHARGITGAGTTTAVVIPGAGPWPARDLAACDPDLRLPAARPESQSSHGTRPGRPGDPVTGCGEPEGTLDLGLARFTARGYG